MTFQLHTEIGPSLYTDYYRADDAEERLAAAGFMWPALNFRQRNRLLEELRLAGATIEELALAFDLSHSRVKQVIVLGPLEQPAQLVAEHERARRIKLTRYVASEIRANPYITRPEILARFDMAPRHFIDVVPSAIRDLLLTTPVDLPDREEARQSIREAAAKFGEPLGAQVYDDARGRGEITGMTRRSIAKAYPDWLSACADAGVNGMAYGGRPSPWSEPTTIAKIAEFLRLGMTSYDVYRAWSAGDRSRPSVATRWPTWPTTTW